MSKPLATWFAVLGLAISTPVVAQQANRITILSDAFGTPSDLERDWGYSALVEYDGKRILFDTGNDAEHFAKNVRLLGVDLTRLDAVVISHRHGDHTDGLRHLMTVNPTVTIYHPRDEYFGGETPRAFFSRPVPALPIDQQYFGGSIPSVVPHGTPWDGAVLVRGHETQIAPGIRLVENVSPGAPFNETPELTLIIDTPEGQVILVGCSHPGIERILASASAREKPVHLLAGGLHMVTSPDTEVERVTSALRNEWRVARVAPGHCAGEYAFHALRVAYGDHYLHAGVGSVIPLPRSPSR
jgi:7,8-dihydropterin-6-yl-methyl-4-(beta-D-ribofuranosyl)aminobenzene 5'-phosphate synthase